MIDRDEVLARTDLRLLLDELAGPPARLGPGARWHCIDPDHPDHHPSVTVFTDRRGIERWRCWSGGHGGTAVDALVVAHGRGVREALEELAQRAGLEAGAPVPAPRPRPPRPAPERRPPHPDLQTYVEACRRVLWGPAGWRVREWLVDDRGIPEDVLQANLVGADPGLARLPRGRGLPRGGPGAVLPALAADGQVAYCQLRYLEPPAGRAKYDNPASRLAVNPRLAWTVAPTPRCDDRLIVCEGALDSYTVAAAGLASVALLGASCADDRVAGEILRHLGGRRLVLALDPDDAGRRAAHRLRELVAPAEATELYPPAPFGDLNEWARQRPDWSLDDPTSPRLAPVGEADAERHAPEPAPRLG